MLLGVLLRNLLLDLLRDSLWDRRLCGSRLGPERFSVSGLSPYLILSPISVAASLICGFNEPAPLPCRCLSLVGSLWSLVKFWATHGLPSLRLWCTVGIDRDQRDVTTSPRPHDFKTTPTTTKGWRSAVIMGRDVCILSTVETENTCSTSKLRCLHCQVRALAGVLCDLPVRCHSNVVVMSHCNALPPLVNHHRIQSFRISQGFDIYCELQVPLVPRLGRDTDGVDCDVLGDAVVLCCCLPRKSCPTCFLQHFLINSVYC